MTIELKSGQKFKEVLKEANIKLVRFAGGPFVPDSFDPKLIQALTKLAEESFSGFPPEDVVREDFLGRDLLYLLTSGEKLVGAASRQIAPISFRENSAKLLYLCSSAIFKEFRGRGLSRYFYGPVFDDVTPDVVATTTKVPAIYKQFTKLAFSKRLIFAPVAGEEVTPQLYELGNTILVQSVRNPDQLDRQLVRRGYLPESLSVPYLEFEFFEKNLAIAPQDGVLLIGAKPDLVKAKGE